VEGGRPRFDADQGKRAELAERFLHAAGDGDIQELESLLAADAAAYGDGGGKVIAARRPVYGAQKVARYIAKIVSLAGRRGYGIRPAWVNRQPGFVVTGPEGALDSVWSLDVADGHVQSVRIVRNPDKLRHLGGP
jgi:RNA polymerase sigma-70 factor (ECF subfamily)